MPAKKRPIEDRFWEKVLHREGLGCWLWVAATSAGYGVFWVKSKNVLAHRFSWELHNGTIPEGMTIDHRVCRNKLCVNPGHMVVCSLKENVTQPDSWASKMMNAEFCKKGHIRSTSTSLTTNGGQYCLICRREASRKNYNTNPKKYEVREVAYRNLNRERRRDNTRRWRESKKTQPSSLVNCEWYDFTPSLMRWFRSYSNPQQETEYV